MKLLVYWHEWVTRYTINWHIEVGTLIRDVECTKKKDFRDFKITERRELIIKIITSTHLQRFGVVI